MASLLTVALHGKLEYFTDILKTLLNDLVEQNVAKNPKLMLRRRAGRRELRLQPSPHVHAHHLCLWSSGRRRWWRSS